jgi:heme-binding NEAT domain protein
MEKERNTLKMLSKRMIASLLVVFMLFSMIPLAAAESWTVPLSKVRDGEYIVTFNLLKNGTDQNSYAWSYVDSQEGKLIVDNGSYKFQVRFNNYDWFEYWGTLKPGAAPQGETAGAAAVYNQADEIEVKAGQSARGPESQLTEVEKYYGTVEFPIENILEKQELLMHIKIKDLYLGGVPFNYDNWYRAQLQIDTANLPIEPVNGGEVESGPVVGLDDLNGQIEEAAALLNSTEDGNWHNAYIPGARKYLELAIEQAKAIADGNTSTVEQITAAYYELKLVLSHFERYKVSVNKDELWQTILAGQELKNDSSLIFQTTVESVMKDGMVPSAYVNTIPTVLAELQATFDDSKASQKLIDEKKKKGDDTWKAISDLRYKTTEIPLIVLDSLDEDAEISELAGLFEPTVTLFKGSQPRQNANVTFKAAKDDIGSLKYFRPSDNKIDAAFVAAELVPIDYSDADAEQYTAQFRIQVSSEANGIVKFNFTEAETPSDTRTVYFNFNSGLLQKLNDNIASAQALHDNAVTGSQDGQYEADVKVALQAAIATARTTGNQLSATKLKIQNASLALQQAVETFKAAVNQPGSTNPGTTDPGSGNPTELSDGKYMINYRILKKGTSETSVMDEYVAHPGRLLIVNGQKYVQILLKQSYEVNTFKVSGSNTSVVESDTANNTRRVQFPVADLTAKLDGWVKVDWEAISYNHEYEVDIELGSYTKVNDWGTEAFGQIIDRENPGSVTTPDAGTKPDEDIEPTEPDSSTTPGNGNGTGAGNGNGAVIAFADLSNHWATKSIERAVSLGIVSGYANGTFKPNHEINRAEWTTVLVRALKPQGTLKAISFADESSIKPWAKKYIEQATTAGIINGFADETFRPDAAVSRSDMAIMVVRALGLPLEQGDLLTFADAGEIPAYARAYVATAVKYGLLSGQGNNKFGANKSATRAEAVTLILRVVDYAHKEQTEVAAS